jgi:solute carrier family 35 (adenosine 3'-phospho 5'-phosphosulfate transporter), member B2
MRPDDKPASAQDDGPFPTGVWRYLPDSKVMMCVVGIIGSLLMYALLQERIMTKPYTNAATPAGAEGEYFGNSLVLVCANRLAAAAVATTILVIKGDWTELRNKAPLYKYLLISVSNVIATSCQYEALKWVSFPTQTLAKSAKMIPVLIWGTIMSGKRHGVVDYSVAVSIALGCTMFMVSGPIAAKKANAADSSYGLLLMLGYLGFDGFTSTFQEKLFAGYSMSIYQQMTYVNGCSAVMSVIFLIISGKALESIAFIAKYPQVLGDMTILSFSAVSGQFAISYTIKTFGALLYATIMTVRQFLSVFISNIVFRHGMHAMQWLGAGIVFCSLFYKSLAKSRAPKRSSKIDPPAQTASVTVHAEHGDSSAGPPASDSEDKPLIVSSSSLSGKTGINER